MKKQLKTMTLNLTDQEMKVVDSLCEKKGMNKTALIKQALRLYQTVENRIERGDRLFFESDKLDKSEIVLL